MDPFLAPESFLSFVYRTPNTENVLKEHVHFSNCSPLLIELHVRRKKNQHTSPECSWKIGTLQSLLLSELLQQQANPASKLWTALWWKATCGLIASTVSQELCRSGSMFRKGNLSLILRKPRGPFPLHIGGGWPPGRWILPSFLRVRPFCTLPRSHTWADYRNFQLCL